LLQISERSASGTFFIRVTETLENVMTSMSRQTISVPAASDIVRGSTKCNKVLSEDGSRDTELFSLNRSELLSESYEMNKVLRSTFNHNEIIEKY
jgi:hypothetical protein